MKTLLRTPNCPDCKKQPISVLLTALIIAISLISGCSKNPEMQVRYILQKAKELQLSGDYFLVIDTLFEAISLAPDNPEIYLLLGDAYEKTLQTGKAEAAYKKIIELFPTNKQAVFKMARLKIVQLEFDQAEALITRLPQNKAFIEKQLIKGDVLFLQNNYSEAVHNYQEALRQSPNNANISARLACGWFAVGNLQEAELHAQKLKTANVKGESLLLLANYAKLSGKTTEVPDILQEAITKDPGNLNIHKALAEFYYQSGQNHEAIAACEKVLQTFPGVRFFIKLQLEIMLRLGRLEEAAKLFESWNASHVLDIEFLLLKGKYYLLRNEPNFAVSQFTEAAQKEPKMPLPHYLLAIAHLCGGHLNLAQQSAIQALTLDPYYSDAELLLADIFYKKMEYGFSTEHAQRILEREPENFRVHMILGLNALDQKNFNDALQYFYSAWLLNPDFNSPQYFVALSNNSAGNSQGARENYQKLLLQTGGTISGLIQFVESAQLDQIPSAIDFLSKLRQTNPKNEFILLAIADLEVKRGNTEAALQALENAISVNPKLTGAYGALANIYQHQQKWEKYLDILEKGYANNPFEAQTVLRLSLYYQDAGTPSRAIEILEKGLTANPTDASILNGLAWFYLENERDIDKAFILAQKAYEYNPDDPAVADTLGWAYYKKNILTRAKWLLSEALKAEPNNAAIHYHLGKVAVAHRDYDLARTYFTQAYKLDLPQPLRQDAEKFLAD